MIPVLWRMFGLVGFGLAAFGSFNLAAMIVDDHPPIVYKLARAKAPTAVQGGTITVEFEVVRDRRCDMTVRRILVDSVGARHTIPTYTVGFPNDLGRERYEREITIPASAAVGPATYQVTLRYACNVIQQAFGWPIEVEAPPIEFEITARPGWLLPMNHRR